MGIDFLVSLKMEKFHPSMDVATITTYDSGTLLYAVPTAIISMYSTSNLLCLEGSIITSLEGDEEIYQELEKLAVKGELDFFSYYKGSAVILAHIFRAERELTEAEEEIEVIRRNWHRAIVDKQAAESELAFARKLKKMALSLKMKNDYFIFEFKDVIASDIRHMGPDIKLGDLTVGVKIEPGTVVVDILEGSYPRSTPYRNGAFHPHQLSNHVCLGTYEPDMYAACRELNFEILEVLLQEMVTSYNSEDGAGSLYTNWVGENHKLCEITGKYYPESEFVYSDVLEEYYHESLVCYSDYHSSFIREDFASMTEVGWVLDDRVSTDYEGRLYPEELLVEIDGEMYYIESSEVSCIDGKYVLITEDNN